MIKDWIWIKNTDFVLNDRPFRIKGVALGSYSNLEHFMLKIPGTESLIRKAISDTFCKENSKRFWAKFFESFFREEDAIFLKEIGVNTIRLPFNYHHFFDDYENTIKEEGFSIIDRVINICEKNEIYVILDLHAAMGGQNPDWHSDNPTGKNLFWEYGVFQEITIELWKHIAARYKDRASVLGYDILNEPVIEDREISGEIINNFYNKVISTIREVDKKHIIFLEGDFYATDTSKFQIPDDPLVAYSIHFYPFFHVEKNIKKFTKMNRIEKKNFIIESLQKTSLNDIYTRLKRPVWCGETGIPHNIKNKYLLEELIDITLEVFNEKNISWTIWTYKDAGSMGMVHFKKDSGWAKFSERFAKRWQFLREFKISENLAIKHIRKILPELIPSRELIRKVNFSLLSIKDLILAEKLKEELKKVKFEEFYLYPESFLFGNCKKWDRLVEIIRDKI